MKQFFVALVLVLASSALALELPASLEFNLVDDAGNVVGTGELTEAGLELELLARFEGEGAFVTLIGVDASGNVVQIPAQIGVGGRLLIDFEDVGGAVAAAGGEVEVEFEDEVGADEFLDEPVDADDVTEGLERAAEEAAEEAQEALERAAQAAERSAEEAAEAAERASEEAEEAAERVVEAAERAVEQAERATEATAADTNEDEEADEEEESDASEDE